MTLSLSRWADLRGDRTALVDASADRRVSYADLDREAEAMAGRIAGLGVGPGDAVAVVSRNRVETLALLFAVRRLGAVLAPVSHRLTPATVAGPLEAVDPDVVVHEAAQRDLVREVPEDVTYSFEELAREDGTAYEPDPPDPDDSLLYLHETERADRGPVGANGESDRGAVGDDEEADRSAVGDDGGADRRGVSLDEAPRSASRVVGFPARAVEWNCVTAVAAWGLGRGDCAPALLPFSDAAGLLGLALPLLYVGGRVAVLRAFDPEDALATVADEGATALFAGATEYRELVECDAFGSTDFGSVAWIATRSRLPADAREALAREAPVCRTYGRAATGPNVLLVPPGSAGGDPVRAERDGPSTDSEQGSDAVGDRAGRPFPDCEVRVVGDDGDPLPEGEAGELRVRGPVTARGYLSSDDGERTTEPFPEWVPTGDLASREEGDYYLVGPASEAVRSATGTARSEGEHVHPRTVERALESREGVSAAGVVPDPEGVLAAFAGETDPGELRAVADEALPAGATLRRLDRVASLPRRPTGEVDRAELRRQLGGEERFDEE